MKRDIFIKRAWLYANYYLHIKNLATLLKEDALVKHFHLNKDNAKRKITYEITNHYYEEFTKTYNSIRFEYDKYSHTISKNHKEYVHRNFLKLIEKRLYL